MASDSAYDTIPDFGLLYDSVPLYGAREDIRFYVEEAANVGGRVLELGCGTGRILLPLARAGHTVTGVDSSARMLERCRAKLGDEAPAIQHRVALHQADVRTVHLHEAYDLIIAPFRVMQHLTTVEDQLRFLQAVVRHLGRDGLFVFDVFNPNLSALVAADGVEREDTPAQSLPDGRVFRRTARVSRVRWVDQVSEIELIYHVASEPGGPMKPYVHGFDMRWYLWAELQHLLARGGLRVRSVYGAFDRSPLVDHSPEQIVRAVRSEASAHA